MEWISVKDRLPIEYKRHYLVMSRLECYQTIFHEHKLDYVQCIYEISFWDYGSNNVGEWCEHYFRGDREITHWMSFPLGDNHP